MPDLVSWTSLQTLMWAARLWPLVVALSLLAVRWSRSHHRLAAFVFFSLLGFGVQWVIGSILVRLPVSVPPDLDYEKSLVLVFAETGWRNLALSVVCTIPLAVWLSRFFMTPKPTGADS
jgi:hypothetical protein